MDNILNVNEFDPDNRNFLAKHSITSLVISCSFLFQKNIRWCLSPKTNQTKMGRLVCHSYILCRTFWKKIHHGLEVKPKKEEEN